MRILSLSFATVGGGWGIDFSTGAFTQNEVFGLSADHKEDAELWPQALVAALGADCLSAKLKDAAVRFETGGKAYDAIWRASEDALNPMAQSHALLSIDGRLHLKGAEAVKGIEEVSGFSPIALKDAFVLNAEQFENFLEADEKQKVQKLNDICRSLSPGHLRALTQEILLHRLSELTVLGDSARAITVLSPQVESEDKNLLRQLSEAAAALKQQEQSNLKAREWLNEIATLREEYARLVKQQNELSSEVSRFDIKRAVLEKAKKALALYPQYALLAKQRELLEETQRRIDEIKRQLPAMNEKARLAASATSEATDKRNKALDQGEHLMQQLRLTRQVDATLERLGQALEEKSRELDTAEKKLQQLKAEKSQTEAFLSDSASRLRTLKKKMEGASVDGTLQENLPQWERDILKAQELVEALELSKATQRTLLQKQEQYRAQTATLSSSLEEQRKARLLLENDLTLKKRSLSRHLAGSSEHTLNQELAAQNEQIAQLSQMLNKVEHLGQIAERRADLERQIEALEKEKLSAQTQLDAASSTLRDKEEVAEARLEAANFLKTVISLQSLRDELEHGSPCPLCGAIHHPFKTTLPSVSKTEANLQKALAELELARDKHNQAVAHLQAIDEALAGFAPEFESLQGELTTQRDSLLEQAQMLNIAGLRDKKTASWGQLLRQRLTLQSTRRDLLAERIRKIDEAIEACHQTQSALSGALDNSDQLQAQLSQASSAAGDCAQQLQHLQQTEKTMVLNREALVRQLERTFLRFGMKASTIAAQLQNMPLLHKRRNQWQQWSNEEALLTQQTQQASEKVEQSGIAQQQQNQEVVRIQQELARLREEIRHQEKQRSELLGSQDTNELEKTLTERMIETEEALRQATENKKQRDESLQLAQTQFNELSVQEAEVARELKTLESQFKDRLAQDGFTSESNFLASRVSDKQRLEMQDQQDELERRTGEIAGKLSACADKLTQLEKLSLTTLDLSSLEGQAQEYGEQNARLSEQTQQIRERLSHNEANKKRLQRELSALSRAQKQTEKIRLFAARADAQDFCTSADEFASVAFEVLSQLAGEALSAMKPDWVLETASGFNLQLLGSEVGSPQAALRRPDLLISLALCLALSKAISGSLEPSPLLLKGLQTQGSSQAKVLLEALAGCGRTIGLINPEPSLEALLTLNVHLTDGFKCSGPGVRAWMPSEAA